MKGTIVELAKKKIEEEIEDTKTDLFRIYDEGEEKRAPLKDYKLGKLSAFETSLALLEKITTDFDAEALVKAHSLSFK